MLKRILCDQENLPFRERMSSGQRRYGRHSYSLMYSCVPFLHRYLRGYVGQEWCVAFSKLKEVFRVNRALEAYTINNLKNEIAVAPIIKINEKGEKFVYSGRFGPSELSDDDLYVENGIIKIYKRPARYNRYQWSKEEYVAAMESHNGIIRDSYWFRMNKRGIWIMADVVKQKLVEITVYEYNRDTREHEKVQKIVPKYKHCYPDFAHNVHKCGDGTYQFNTRHDSFLNDRDAPNECASLNEVGVNIAINSRQCPRKFLRKYGLVNKPVEKISAGFHIISHTYGPPTIEWRY